MKKPRRTNAERAAGTDLAPTGEKWCSKGEHWAALDEFARSTRHGRQRWCQRCRTVYMREWRARGLRVSLPKPAASPAAAARDEVVGSAISRMLARLDAREAAKKG